MRYYSIYDLVGIEVDDQYPWQDTLFITQGVAVEGYDTFANYKTSIHIVYDKNINKKDVRPVDEGAYIGDRIYVDERYGVRIDRLATNRLQLSVVQECNEWLVIAIELMLLVTEHTFIHAASVEKDGHVLLMPSWGGVGKTATVCKFIREHGWRLLGDDLVIVGKTGVRPFLKPFVIYPYHKSLFPELFQNNKNHTIKNLKISSLMSRMIPAVKRVMRPFPRLLAFARKHNPQSMRVSPYRIFEESQLSSGGKLSYVVWLERNTEEHEIYRSLSAQAVASRSAAVSSTELFAEKLNAVFHLCGSGMFDYQDILNRIYQVIFSSVQNISCSVLAIPTSVQIEKVGDLVYTYLSTNLKE